MIKMLQLANTLINIPIMSLRTGGMVATADTPIINPNNLKLEGWYCHDQFSKKTLILLTRDVRDLVPQGLAVDDYNVLAEPEELVRLKDVLHLNFELIDKQVITDNKRKLGKVGDYASDTTSFMIQKLYVNQPVYKNLSDGQLIVDRSQIIEINDRQIIVRDVDEKIGSAIPAVLGLG